MFGVVKFPIISMLSAVVMSAQAMTNIWDAVIGTSGAQDGSGIWLDDTNSTNWWTGLANVPWENSALNSAIIGAGDGAAGVITLGSPITVGNLRFNAPGSGAYTIEGNDYPLIFGIDDPVLWVSAGVTVTNRANSVNDTRNLDLTGGGSLVLTGTNLFNSIDMADASTANGGIAGIAGTTLTIPANANLTLDSTTPFAGWGVSLRLRDQTTLNVDGTLTTASSLGGFSLDDNYTININSGASVSIGSELILGWNSPATLNMNGGNLTVNSWLLHKDGQSAVLNLNGGTIETGRIATDSGNGTFVVNFNGGTLRARSNNLFNEGTQKSNLTVFKVLDGGAIINSNGQNIETVLTFQGVGSGGLIKAGSGTMTFTGGSYTGATIVTEGTLNLSFNKRATGMAWGSVSGFHASESRIVLNGGHLAVTGRASASSVTRSFTVGGPIYNYLCARSGNTAGLVAGMSVSGTDIPADTYIACVKSSSTLLLNQAAVNSTAGTRSLTFDAVNDITFQRLPALELQQDAVITVDNNNGPGTTLALSDITGAGGLTKAGSGTLMLSGLNTYGGSTVIEDGTILLTRDEMEDAVPNASFETHNPLGNNGTWSYSPGGATWTFQPNGGIAVPGSPWIDANAYIDGDYAGFIQNNGQLITTFTAPTSGLCIFSFLAGERPNYKATALAIQIDGETQFSIPSTAFTKLGDIFTGTAYITAGTHTLTLRGTQIGTDSATWIDQIELIYSGHGGLTDIMPSGSEATVAAGAILDLNGHTQNLTALSGGGLVTNGTLNVNGLIAPGGMDSEGTLTVTSEATLQGTLLVDVAQDGSCDTLVVPGALDVSNLALQIQDTALLNPPTQYVIARFEPRTLISPFISNNLGDKSIWRVVYDNILGEIRIELIRGSLIIVR